MVKFINYIYTHTVNTVYVYTLYSLYNQRISLYCVIIRVWYIYSIVSRL